MNVKRFTARTSRDALALVRQAFGDDAVVMSTRPCPEGVEVLAMAPESLQQIERLGASAPRVTAPAAAPAALPPASAMPSALQRRAAAQARVEPRMEEADHGVEQDVEALAMSTLSFQDYVRERMLKRRQAEMSGGEAAVRPAAAPQQPPVASFEAARARQQAAARREPPVLRDEIAPRPAAAQLPSMTAATAAGSMAASPAGMGATAAAARDPLFGAGPALAAGDAEMMNELRSMRGLIEQRFGALAFMEKLQRHPRQAALTQKLLDAGFSPGLSRKLAESLPGEGDELAWAAGVLARNLATGEREPALEDQGGVYALIGSTGVGKTTSTAKLAAAFATRHGAAHLGLITLDAYRVGAHEQLRTYGRILGVPVHTAHDRASLEDLLELLSAKKMVLIDTAGMAQRDSRTRELLDMLQHRSIQRLLVVNASAQGETIDEVVAGYEAARCRGVVLSKIDEAAKLGPALDSMIRHKLRVLAVGNGQRVPEDWHRLGAVTLVQRALRSATTPAWKLDGSDMNLVFAAAPQSAGAAIGPAAAPSFA